MAFSIQQAARTLAEVQDGIDWCRRVLQGGVMYSEKNLLDIHKHVQPDYRDLLRKLLEKKKDAESELTRFLKKDDAQSPQETASD